MTLIMLSDVDLYKADSKKYVIKNIIQSDITVLYCIRK